MKSTDYSFPSSLQSSRRPIPSNFETADLGEISGRTESEDDLSNGSEKMVDKKVIFFLIYYKGKENRSVKKKKKTICK
jgi:hypothetical protein